MSLKKIITLTSAILGVVGVITIGFTVDSFYAHSAEVLNLAKKIELTNARLEQKIRADEMMNLVNRAWHLEDRIVQNPSDSTAIEQLRIVKQLIINVKAMYDSKVNLGGVPCLNQVSNQ